MPVVRAIPDEGSVIDRDTFLDFFTDNFGRSVATEHFGTDNSIVKEIGHGDEEYPLACQIVGSVGHSTLNDREDTATTNHHHEET